MKIYLQQNFNKPTNAPWYFRLPGVERKRESVTAPSASVTATSVPWQILLPVDLHSSRTGRQPPQTPHKNATFSTPRVLRWRHYTRCS